MSRIKSLRLGHAVLAMTMLLSGMVSAADGRAGCGQAPPNGVSKAAALASMNSRTPLYVMEDSGRLVKMDLRTSHKTILSDHGFYMTPTLRPSGDGRWLSYSGVLKGANKTQYWLYDRQTQSESLVYEHPAWGGGIPSFSPDSRYLVISAGYDHRWTDASRAGIYLFDTKTRRLKSVPLPTHQANRTAWISADWTQDGKALLILVRNMAAKEGFDYFSYRLATKKVEALSGSFNRTAFRHEFRRGAQAISALDEIKPRSELSERSAWSPRRSWHAHLDERRQDGLPYRLHITSKAGGTRPVAVGRFEHCEGATLHIIGWLDERHLAYRHSMNYFLFDAETGTTAVLFSEEQMPITFTW